MSTRPTRPKSRRQASEQQRQTAVKAHPSVAGPTSHLGGSFSPAGQYMPFGFGVSKFRERPGY